MRRSLIVLFALILTNHLKAQPEIKLETRFAPGYELNIFNSPDFYIRPNGDTLNRDQLVADAAFLYFEGDLDLEWKKKRGEINWSTNAELIRYSEYTQANATEVQTRLSYDSDIIGLWQYGGELRLRLQDRLGLNVLGSELLTPFSFRQVQPSAYLKYEWEKGHETQMELIYSYKDYDQCDSCGLRGESVSLTQREFELRVEQEFEINQGPANQKLKFTARFRDRYYYDWLNYDILATEPDPITGEPFIPFDPNGDYESREWQYFIFKADYDFPLSDELSIKPSIEYTQRLDRSNGDFGFGQWQPGLFAYLRADQWYGRLYMSYTMRDYTDRRAAQDDGPPLPLLTYEYLRARFLLERQLKKGFSIWTELAYNNRNSNTSEVNTRVRRSYENSALMLGVKWEWEK